MGLDAHSLRGCSMLVRTMRHGWHSRHRKMDKGANVMCTWTMKTVLMGALVVVAACGGVLLGLGAQVLGQTAVNQPERGERVAHSE